MPSVCFLLPYILGTKKDGEKDWDYFPSSSPSRHCTFISSIYRTCFYYVLSFTLNRAGCTIFINSLSSVWHAISYEFSSNCHSPVSFSFSVVFLNISCKLNVFVCFSFFFFYSILTCFRFYFMQIYTLSSRFWVTIDVS